MNYQIKNRPRHYDVIIAGGGPAGCAAAIAAARQGAKTLVVEAATCLGGMATAGMVSKWAPFDDQEKVIYKSVALEVLERYKEAAGLPKDAYRWVDLYPEVLKRVYDDMLQEAGAQVLFSSQVVDAIMDGRRISYVLVANKAGITPYTADAYVDCTGDADLAYFAGVPFEQGNEDGVVQNASLCFIIANVHLDKRNGKKLSSNPADSVWGRMKQDGKYLHLAEHFIPAYQGIGCMLVNAGDISGLDSTDPEAVSRAMAYGRDLAEQYLNALKEYEPEIFGDAAVVATAPSMGVRESRRIRGQYRLTMEDYIARRSFPDEVCRNSYWLDCHDSTERTVEIKQYGPGDSHGIPWRCMIPENVDNLLVAGRSISMERMVLASVRVMPNCLGMGTAAGVGAAIASREKTNVCSLDVQKVLAVIDN